MILPSAARTADISPSLLDDVTVREFYRARAGQSEKVSAVELDYLEAMYHQAVNPAGYTRMVAEYRSMLLTQINLDAARLVVALPYARHKDLYSLYGLTGNPKQTAGRLRELERAAQAARQAYVGASRAPSEAVKAKDWAEEMTGEVAVLSRYLGFAIDPHTMAIGVYIGYLSIMAAESEKNKKH